MSAAPPPPPAPSSSLNSSLSPSEKSGSLPSLTVTVKFFSTVRNTTGVPETQLTVPRKEKLVVVLRQIETTFFQPKGTHFLKSDGSGLEPGFLCLVDDADMQLTGGLTQTLKKNCTVTLLSSLHGG